MMRRALLSPVAFMGLLLTAGIVAVGCARNDADAAVEAPFLALDLAAASAKAQAEEKLVFVDLWASWCGPCKLLDRTTWKDATVQELLATRAVPIKVNVDDHPDIAQRFKVESIPTLLVLKPDGTEVTRVVGYVDAAGFADKFGSTLSRER